MSWACDAADVKRHLHGNLHRHTSTVPHPHSLHRRLRLQVQRRLLCPRSDGARDSETDVVAVDDQLGDVRDLNDGRAVRREITNAHCKHVLPTHGKITT